MFIRFFLLKLLMKFNLNNEYIGFIECQANILLKYYLLENVHKNNSKQCLFRIIAETHILIN